MRETGCARAAGVGDGGLGPDLGVFRARGQSGATVILVQANEGGMSTDLRSLFPRYVEAEARPPRLRPAEAETATAGWEPLTSAWPPCRKLPQIRSVDLRVG